MYGLEIRATRSGGNDYFVMCNEQVVAQGHRNSEREAIEAGRSDLSLCRSFSVGWTPKDDG